MRDVVLSCLTVAFLLAASPAISHEPNAAAASDRFVVGDLAVGMSLEAVLERYPDARVIDKPARRYCYGEAVELPALLRREAIIAADGATLWVGFSAAGLGGRVTSVRFERVIAFDPAAVTGLREAFLTAHGPYTRVLYPRKMEPAGLIVGFEWVREWVASLIITIHRDHANDSGRVLMTARLTDALRGLRRAKAAIYRVAVRAFSRACGKRG